MPTESEYLIFHKLESKGKTEIFEVRSKDGILNLGTIKWYSRWRRYCFFPMFETIWSEGCLKEVTSFIGYLMDKRKKKGIPSFIDYSTRSKKNGA
jgi:hypothetical protein